MKISNLVMIAVCCITVFVPVVFARTLDPQFRDCMRNIVEQYHSAIIESQRQYDDELESAMAERKEGYLNSWDNKDDNAQRQMQQDADRRFSERTSQARRAQSDRDQNLNRNFSDAQRLCKSEASSRSSSSQSASLSASRSSSLSASMSSSLSSSISSSIRSSLSSSISASISSSRSSSISASKSSSISASISSSIARSSSSSNSSSSFQGCGKIPFHCPHGSMCECTSPCAPGTNCIQMCVWKCVSNSSSSRSTGFCGDGICQSNETQKTVPGRSMYCAQDCRKS